VGKPEGKEAPARCMHRWDNFKINLKEIGLKGMDRITLAQDRDKWQAVVRTVMNPWFS
jgi:hypothetical protein